MALTQIVAQAKSVPAAKVAAELLEQMRERGDADAHRARLANPDPLAVAQYLGEIGASDAAVIAQLGRQPTREESAAYDRGAALRAAEVQALALARARRGTAKAEPWMFRH